MLMIQVYTLLSISLTKKCTAIFFAHLPHAFLWYCNNWATLLDLISLFSNLTWSMPNWTFLSSFQLKGNICQVFSSLGITFNDRVQWDNELSSLYSIPIVSSCGWCPESKTELLWNYRNIIRSINWSSGSSVVRNLSKSLDSTSADSSSLGMVISHTEGDRV